MKRAWAFALMFALAACEQAEEKGYPPAYELNFMQACAPQAQSQAYCACVWDKIEANIAPDDFAALEQMPPPARESSPLQQQIVAYANACRAQQQTEAPEAP